MATGDKKIVLMQADIGTEGGVAPAGLTKRVSLYVSPDGNDNTGNGTQASPFRQIQKAIDSLPKNLNGNRVDINVGEGTFDGFDCDSHYAGRYWGPAIRITGAGQDLTIVNGGISCYGTDSVYIEGITCKGSMVAYCVKAVELFKVKFDGETDFGVSAHFGTVMNLDQCTISNKTGYALIADASTVYIRNIQGENNAVCYCAGSYSGGRPGMIIGTTGSITGTVVYKKNYGGIIFAGGELV